MNQVVIIGSFHKTRKYVSINTFRKYQHSLNSELNDIFVRCTWGENNQWF